MADGISAGRRNGLWWKGSDGQRWTVAPRGILPFQRCCAPLLGLIAWGAQDAAHRRRGLGAQTAERVSAAQCDE